MSDKPRGRARGRGRGQSPPPPGGQPLPVGMRPALPGMRPTQQEMMPVQPGIGPTQPGMRPVQPGMRPVQPGMRPAQPGMMPAQPGMRPAQPGMRPTQPGMRPVQPGMSPAQPGMRPTQPGVRPAQPGMRPVQPGMRPAQPGMRPAQPGMRPTQPAMRPAEPGMRPAQPGMRPGESGMRPAQPGMRPGEPGMRPAQPGMRPNHPGERPAHPRPLQPGQLPTPATARPTAPGTRPAPQQEATTRPDTTHGRAFYRGTERMQSAVARTAAASEVGLAEQIGAINIGYLPESSEGTGNGNGNGATSVGRGMSRGLGRLLEGKLSVLRPHNNVKIGSGGRPIRLQVNYFALEKKQDWCLHQYDVKISPDQDDRRQRWAIMEPHLKHFEGHVFDGTNIFSTIRLPEKVTTFSSKTDVVYTVTVTLIKELDSMDEQFMRFLNLILRRCQNYINLKLIGRHYFNTAESKSLDAQLKLVVFPGYQTSIRQHEEKILLNVDIVHKFQQQTTLLEKIVSMSAEEMNSTFVGTIVMARYNNLTYRIDSIRTDISPRDKFEYRGALTSYIDYYQQKYNIKITNPGQPMVHSKPTGRQLRSGLHDIFLVPELLSITGIPEDMRRNYNQMKMLADYTKMGVDKRVEALKRFNRQLLTTDKVRDELTKWGLKLSEQLVSVDSRVLEYEPVLLEGVVTNHPADSAEWTSQCRNQSMAVTVHLKNWVVLAARRAEQDVGSFIDVLQRAGRSIGMNIASPEVIIVNHVSQCESEIGRQAGKQIIMIIMDRSLSTKYGQLKKRLACQIGVLSQCVMSNNLTKKGVMSIATKIAIQMNAKLGGEPWRIQQPAKTAMVVGYDAYHDNMSPNKSYGAVVSSINPQCTRWYGQVNAHNNKEELSDNFALCIRNAVDHYHRSNGNNYPGTLIVYRDGVGEGQIDHVKEHEIPAIKRQLSQFGAEVAISLIFIVVSKRINTRIFAEQGGRLVNPSPGTIVDKTITLPHQYDFFLVSQKVTQGTVTPTLYNVLEDSTRLGVTQVQRLTYKFTHLYYNWQGTVRVPAPCLYAHKLAYMTGTGTHELPKAKLIDKLWFI